MKTPYHTKKSFKLRMKTLHQHREKLAKETVITPLSTLNQHYQEWKKAMKDHARHPGGTRASGLRKGKTGKGLIAQFRNRFGEAEEQSSRLRRLRRAGNHTVRLKEKKELKDRLKNLDVN